jgi:hypothetical protein
MADVNGEIPEEEFIEILSTPYKEHEQQVSDNNNQNIVNDDDIKVYPVGGYGKDIRVINDFEIKQRFKLTETALYTNLRVSWKIEKVGDQSNTPGLTQKEAKIYLGLEDRISTHNHPKQNNADGGSFSPDDITSFILQEDLELRVVDYYYAYVMQRPVVGWDVWKNQYPETIEYKLVNGTPDFTGNPLYQFFDQVFIANRNKLKLAAEKGIGKNDPRSWFEDSLHVANLLVSRKYRIPYARYVDNR